MKLIGKKLIYLKLFLNVILVLFTLSFIWWYGLVFYNNYKILSKKEQYKSQKFIITDAEYTSTGNSGSPIGVRLFGNINNNRIFFGADPDYIFKIGDTVYVWYDGIKNTRERYPNETHTDFVERYEKEQKKIIIYVFTPYILLWLIVILIRIKKGSTSNLIGLHLLNINN